RRADAGGGRRLLRQRGRAVRGEFGDQAVAARPAWRERHPQRPCRRGVEPPGVRAALEKRTGADLTEVRPNRTYLRKQGVGLPEQSLPLSDQGLGLLLGDGLAVELGALEQRDHLSGQRVTLTVERAELALFLCV